MSIAVEQNPQPTKHSYPIIVQSKFYHKHFKTKMHKIRWRYETHTDARKHKADKSTVTVK